MRAWWSQLFEPHSDTHLRSSIACSLPCLEEPTTYSASGPDSLRMASSRSPISLMAWSQERRWYLPFTSFIGYFSRCECSVMPCSRTEASLGAVRPRVEGRAEHRFLPHPHAVLHHRVDGATHRAVRAHRALDLDVAGRLVRRLGFADHAERQLRSERARAGGD